MIDPFSKKVDCLSEDDTPGCPLTSLTHALKHEAIAYTIIGERSWSCWWVFTWLVYAFSCIMLSVVILEYSCSHNNVSCYPRSCFTQLRFTATFACIKRSCWVIEQKSLVPAKILCESHSMIKSLKDKFLTRCAYWWHMKVTSSVVNGSVMPRIYIWTAITWTFSNTVF
jgi:hypothetical protein